jgi:ABC-2 type transport system permease protein
MAGKIGGVALAGIIQFVGWIVFTVIFTLLLQGIFMTDSSEAAKAMETVPSDLFSSSSVLQENQVPISENTTELSNLLASLKSVRFGIMSFAFLLFFILGYVLYSSLYAAIGAMSDPDTDTQQFTLPVTLPLALAIVFLFPVIQNPDGNLALWLSYIPFTSPIIMMARIPFGVPWTQVVLSLTILIAFIYIMVGLSAKIYKTAILLYGKKLSWKEVVKWIKVK